MAFRDWLPPWPRAPINLSNPTTKQQGVAAQEHGTSGTENFGGYIRKEDFNPDFDDWQKAVPIYDKMRRTDAMVRAMLQVIKLPLRGATWVCHPASSDAVDKQIADFCNAAIFEDDSMEDSWDFTLRHILLQLEFGVSVLEKVWKVDEDGHYRFKRLAPRLPKTLREWHVNREGKLVALVQYAPVPHGNNGRDKDGTSRPPRYGSTMSYQYLCLGINERMLTADLRWVPSGEMKVGDKIMSFDEEPSDAQHGRRNWRMGEVTHSCRATAPCVKVHLSDGTSVVCTDDHPWLVEPGGGHPSRWVQAKDLMRGGRGRYGPRRGHFVMKVVHPWQEAQTRQSGWLAGMFDGEGTVGMSRGMQLSIGQVDGPVQDRLMASLKDHGFIGSCCPSSAHARAGRKPFSNIRITGGFHEQLRFLGSIRPERLVDNFQALWKPKLLKTIERVQVVAVESAGLQEIQSISTSTKTYVGEGFLMHNTIPADYCAVFTLEREGDNYEGMSLLRNIYRNYWFKDQAYHVMGVGLDRWGVGIPVAELEEGHNLTTGDKDVLRTVLQAVRSNEKAYMVMPEHVKFKIEPSGSGQGTQGSFGIQWIDHNDSQMARNVLAGFLTMGRDNVGTKGFGSRLTDMFISSLNGIAGGVCADIKSSLVKPLCDFNFDMSKRKYPQPVCLDLEQVDLSALIDVLAKLEGTLITPQDDDEAVIRKMLGLPKLNPHRTRQAILDKQNKPSGNVAATPTPGQMVTPAAAAATHPGTVQEIKPPAADTTVEDYT